MTRYAWSISLLLLCPLGCDPKRDPGDGDAGATEGTSDGGDDGGPSCTPGMWVPCGCSDGAMGNQQCNASGTAFGACECSAADDGGSGEGTGGADTGEGTSTSSGRDTGEDAESSGGEGSSGEPGCTPGEVIACDSDAGPGWSECAADSGEFGPCNACEGSHPLVEGDLRYCEEGVCYCGDLTLDPPVDVCYPEAIADACCELRLVCY